MARKPHIPDFEKMTRGVVAAAKLALHTEAKVFATAEKDMFVEEIRKQDFADFRAFPLSAVTQQKKRDLGLPLLTMLATGTYLKGIAVHEQPKMGNAAVQQIIVGIDPTLPSRDAETGELNYMVPLADVAMIQEYGSPRANIPARRHWGPHFDQMIKRAQPVRRKIVMAIARAWRDASSAEK